MDFFEYKLYIARLWPTFPLKFCFQLKSLSMKQKNEQQFTLLMKTIQTYFKKSK